MLEKGLRSPIMMMVLLIMIGIVFIGSMEGWDFKLYYYPFIGFMVLYFAVLFYHNRKNPEQKIKVFTMVPYELREDDEGLQYISFKAMRKVYIFSLALHKQKVTLSNILSHINYWQNIMNFGN